MNPVECAYNTVLEATPLHLYVWRSLHHEFISHAMNFMESCVNNLLHYSVVHELKGELIGSNILLSGQK